MTKTLYVGNLPWGATEADLSSLFGSMTEVISARIIIDRETGRSRGFGFVEVPANKAETVVAALNGTNFAGRQITVNEARQREERERPRKRW